MTMHQDNKDWNGCSRTETFWNKDNWTFL